MAQTTKRSVPSLIEKYREPLFLLLLSTGMLVFAGGVAFLILGLSMDITAPAPYFASLTDKLIIIAFAVVTIGIGGAIVRFAAKLVGW